MGSIDHISGLSSQLEKLAKHNHDMLKNAESGHWDKVIDAELQRRIMLEALYSSPDIENAPGVANATREMLLINQKLEELATSAHEQAATEAVSINKGRQAISAYTKNVR